MKLPFSEIAKAVGLYQSINKPIGEYPNEAESGLLKLIKEQEDALYAKKNEIQSLKHKILELEDAFKNQTWMLKKKQEELDGERY